MMLNKKEMIMIDDKPIINEYVSIILIKFWERYKKTCALI